MADLRGLAAAPTAPRRHPVCQKKGTIGEGEPLLAGLRNRRNLTSMRQRLALMWVAAMAAMPAHIIVSQSRHGRARTAIAYLSGFGAGLMMTLMPGVVVA